MLILATVLIGSFNLKPIETQATTKKEPSVITIWTDEETGVQYVIYRDKAGYAGFGGITPRLNSDGTLYITKEK